MRRGCRTGYAIVRRAPVELITGGQGARRFGEPPGARSVELTLSQKAQKVAQRTTNALEESPIQGYPSHSPKHLGMVPIFMPEATVKSGTAPVTYGRYPGIARITTCGYHGRGLLRMPKSPSKVSRQRRIPISNTQSLATELRKSTSPLFPQSDSDVVHLGSEVTPASWADIVRTAILLPKKKKQGSLSSPTPTLKSIRPRCRGRYL